MKKVIIISLVIVSCLIFYSQLQAVGISVTPDQLSIQTYVKGEASRDLYLKNISSGPVIYNLYAEELTDQIIIQPDYLRLEASETQRVKVTVIPKEAGVFVTNLAVVAQDLDRRQFNAITGVKIPLDLRVNAAPRTIFSKLSFWGIIGGAVSLIALVTIIIIQRKKRSFWQRLFNK